jgi:hypothetical protein
MLFGFKQKLSFLTNFKENFLTADLRTIHSAAPKTWTSQTIKMKTISSFRMSEDIHGVTSWKTSIFSKAAARTSNLTLNLQQSRCQNLKSQTESSSKPLPEPQISQ